MKIYLAFLNINETINSREHSKRIETKKGIE